MITRRFAAAVALAAGALASVSLSGEVSQTRQAPPRQASSSGQNNPLFVADDLPWLPAGVIAAVRPLSVMKATYEFAGRHPEVMRFVPCFCGCERAGHKDNHDCYVAGRDAKGRVTAWDPHAIHCEVCVDVAHQAWQMHNSGASVAAIRAAVEKKYADKTKAGLHTPTPMPKRGGTSHH